MTPTRDPIDTYARLSGLHRRILAKAEPIQLATVSGVATTKTPLIRYVDERLKPISLITTKSFQVTANPGNREPIICEMHSGSFGNSVGLRNPGMDVAMAELLRLRAEYPMRSLLNVSVSASTVEDFITLVGAFEEVADIIELNFSCPHASPGYGASIGCSAELSSLYIREIRNAHPKCKALIFAKLTPNVEDIGAIARHVMAAGADGIVAINTVGPEIHVEPLSGKPILRNKLGGKGGKSGKWIFGEAIRCVAAIRSAIGPSVPLIGMGGVCTGSDVAAMISAGADVVGIGSAFGKVSQESWADYAEALHADATAVLGGSEDPKQAATWYHDEISMAYQKRRIIDRREHGSDTVVLTLEGSWEYEAGQFVFLWIPDAGEKPFSIAHHDPLTFVIKRRGEFTRALYDLRVGDDLYLRGLYGKPVSGDTTSRALLLAGGTGVAVLPALARRLHGKGTGIVTLVGTTETGGGLLEEHLRPYGTVRTIADDGVPARVLSHIDEAIGHDYGDLACYIVGPSAFMRIAASKLLDRGISPDRIHLSLELNTLCGVGMCGECLCGDRLTCSWGTFMDYRYLSEHAPELLC